MSIASYPYLNRLTYCSDKNPRGVIPGSILEVAEHLKNKDIRARAFQIKKTLVAMARARLPGKMGRVYANVVLSCLTCLDPENQGFGDERNFVDEDGILVGVRYIEKVRSRHLSLLLLTSTRSCISWRRLDCNSAPGE